MAGQFRQIKRSLAEQFCQIKRSLAEQFRQIKRSLTEQWRFNRRKHVKGGGLLGLVWYIDSPYCQAQLKPHPTNRHTRKVVSSHDTVYALKIKWYILMNVLKKHSWTFIHKDFNPVKTILTTV